MSCLPFSMRMSKHVCMSFNIHVLFKYLALKKIIHQPYYASHLFSGIYLNAWCWNFFLSLPKGNPSHTAKTSLSLSVNCSFHSSVFYLKIKPTFSLCVVPFYWPSPKTHHTNLNKHWINAEWAVSEGTQERCFSTTVFSHVTVVQVLVKLKVNFACA